MSAAEAYLKEPYTYVLAPDVAGGYTAKILEFPGCFAEGDTPDATITALQRAAGAWIRAALAQGQTIPPPQSTQGYSGKFALRLPKSLHRQAAQHADCGGVSLNQYCVAAIAAKVGADDLYRRLVATAAAQTPDNFGRLLHPAVPLVASERRGKSSPASAGFLPRRGLGSRGKRGVQEEGGSKIVVAHGGSP